VVSQKPWKRKRWGELLLIPAANGASFTFLFASPSSFYAHSLRLVATSPLQQLRARELFHQRTRWDGAEEEPWRIELRSARAQPRGGMCGVRDHQGGAQPPGG
jgi:hypothetical protein